MGGTMNAPLLHAMRDEMTERSWSVLRFNFRGIGNSKGESGTGEAEVADARGAVAYAKAQMEGLPVAIAGWSFGGAVAFRAAQQEATLLCCIGIAPAVNPKAGITAGLPDPQAIGLRMPGLLICGANDDLIDSADCEQWARAAGIEVQVIPGANHFFWAKYESAARAVADFADASLAQKRPS
jgi:alpha/beta superfamily hydrolase